MTPRDPPNPIPNASLHTVHSIDVRISAIWEITFVLEAFFDMISSSSLICCECFLVCFGGSSFPLEII